MLGLVNNCVAEMTVFMPVSGGFIRMAGKWVDDAFGFMAGWNFFLYEALLIPFEITALNLVVSRTDPWNPFRNIREGQWWTLVASTMAQDGLLASR